MNLEGLTLHILTNKLKEELLGGKIYKVFMPSYESLLLLVKRERDTAALLADFSCGSPILVIRPSSRCLRSSIQKAGGLSGRSGKLFGRYSIGEPQLKSASNAAVSRSRFTSSSSDSYEGIKTLYTYS